MNQAIAADPMMDGDPQLDYAEPPMQNQSLQDVVRLCLCAACDTMCGSAALYLQVHRFLPCPPSVTHSPSSTLCPDMGNSGPALSFARFYGVERALQHNKTLLITSGLLI